MGATKKLLMALVVALLVLGPVALAEEPQQDRPDKRPQIVQERLERQRPPEVRSRTDRPVDIERRHLDRPIPQKVIAVRRPEGPRPGLLRRPDRPGAVRPVPSPQLLRRPERREIGPEVSWAGRIERLVQQMRELAGHVRRMEAQIRQLRTENERLKRILHEKGISISPGHPEERPRRELVRPERRDRDVEPNRDRDRHIDRDRDQRPPEHRDAGREQRDRARQREG